MPPPHSVTRCSHSGALGAREDLLGPEGREARSGQVHARLGAEAGISGEQHRELLLQRHLERVALEAARPLAARGRLRRQGRRVRHRRLCLGDGERAGQRRLRVRPVGAAHRGEPPGAAHPHADADSLALLRVELVEPSVAGREPLDPGTHEARVGIAGARSRGVHQFAEQIPHNFASLPSAVTC